MLVLRTLLSLALTGAAPLEPPLPEAPSVWAAASHTVTVTYAERRGDLRKATVRIAPSGDERPRWSGSVEALAFYGGEKHGWIVVDRLRAADGGLEARTSLPGPDALRAFALRTSAKQTRIWTAPSTQTGEEPPKEPPPDEPPGGPPAEPPGEPPTDEPPPEDDVRDPWGDGDDDGDDGVRDPWGDEATSAGSLRFSI